MGLGKQADLRNNPESDGFWHLSSQSGKSPSCCTLKESSWFLKLLSDGDVLHRNIWFFEIPAERWWEKNNCRWTRGEGKTHVLTGDISWKRSENGATHNHHPRVHTLPPLIGGFSWVSSINQKTLTSQRLMRSKQEHMWRQLSRIFVEHLMLRTRRCSQSETCQDKVTEIRTETVHVMKGSSCGNPWDAAARSGVETSTPSGAAGRRFVTLINAVSGLLPIQKETPQTLKVGREAFKDNFPEIMRASRSRDLKKQWDGRPVYFTLTCLIWFETFKTQKKTKKLKNQCNHIL